MTEYASDSVFDNIVNKKILVANRGITARRIARSIRELGAIPVLTATDVDKSAPFTSGAQELILLGENPRAYLDIDLIIAKAKARSIAAIHPGWGFASENDLFPLKCAQENIIFIGPETEAMRLLGNKVAVRKLARKLNVPTIPGSDGAVTIAEAKSLVKEIGLPVMLKAEGGGGGRGIYEITDESQLDSAFEKATAMAHATFGNPRLFVEKMLTQVRHIEIQVIADRHGNVFAFDERDCTVQRNHQKLVEITPSPWVGMTPELRTLLKDYARKLILNSGYHSLATVEFLLDADGTPYLIEVNTRLQVEHGITECRYGIDLVEEQIAVAFGARLRVNEQQNKPGQCAMQVRINCEDPQDNFSPNAGRITRYIAPGGPSIRLDSCISAGYDFPPQYDSAATLLIAYGQIWPKVLEVMNRALREYIIGGLKTTIPFHLEIINHPLFKNGECDTKFISNNPELLQYADKESEHVRLSRLVAEISAVGYNPFVGLGKYRGREDKRLGDFTPALPKTTSSKYQSPYPRGDRKALLAYVRDTEQVHFTDTTARDITQSNTGNRFRLAEDAIVGPYLDECGFFSLENGGGAHFHVAMLANMTYPFNEARRWNLFAPQTPKQILVRSTNLLGYKPQPRKLMQLTGEMICEHYDIVRCFDFLNHIENMTPIAEVVLNSPANIFEPAIALSWAKGFDIPHYMNVLEEIVSMVTTVSGLSKTQSLKSFIIGLKDMAGVCPPRFIRQLVETIKQKYPELIIHYHRHCTDGLFVPAVGAAAQAGAHIIDTGIGAAVRWYGQGEVLSTSAYIEGEMGLKTGLNKENIRNAGFVLKQIMPYYDCYTAPYFQGIDHDVVDHAMPGGATSSSQEGAMQQGYIHLLPYMLRFLAGTRKIVRYHDVTPGSQITWNTAFLAVSAAFKRGGEVEVQHLVSVIETIAGVPEEEIDAVHKEERLILYRESNDAFRNLLLGKFGRLPLGFPADWVYESAFGSDYKTMINERTEQSPLATIEDIDIDEEREALRSHLKRDPTQDELVMYLNHPGDALKTILFRQRFGNPNRLPLDIWFEGITPGSEHNFKDSDGKPHQMSIIDISEADDQGVSFVRYILDGETFNHPVKIADAVKGKATSVEMADKTNLYHIASPTNGDLWIVYVNPGDVVKKDDEICNITIMKQEKSVLSPIDGVVKRIVKFADYKEDKKMVPVREGELIIELGPMQKICPNCAEPASGGKQNFCPACGQQWK
jgi:pyruvate carboxylase